MKSVKITQQNIRLLLPAKIAATVGLIAKDFQCSQQEALMSFYQSQTYTSLEQEETKFWWMSPLQLYREYRYEKE